MLCGTTAPPPNNTHGRPDWWHRVALGWDEADVVALAGTDDARHHPAPEQHTRVGWLPTTPGVERGPVQHDAVLVDVEHDGVPLSQRLVSELETVGATLPIMRR